MEHVKLVQFINCRLIREGKIVIEDDLYVRNGRIEDPEKIFFDEKGISHVRVDCKGALIAPGFIDLQINGGYGVDFSYDTETVTEGINRVAKGLLENGVTSFCPTLVTSPPETYRKVIPQIQRRAGGIEGASILGVHVEGPFINPTKKGAHPLECIRDYDNGIADALEVYGNMENVQIITMAPEKKNGEQFIKDLVARGITVSLGHSSANLCDGEMAVKAGATLITHLFNAMLPFHHRDPGLVGLLASNEIPEGQQIYFGIISDGVHTHPAALRIAHRTHANGLILVTDAISALGLAEGTHRLGQYTIEVRQGKAFISGTNTLCGSITPLDECIRIFKKATKCSIVYAIEAASLHPARCLGLEGRKGTLAYGADADFVFIDDDLRVKSTWIAGECVYKNDGLTSIGEHTTEWKTNALVQ